MVRGGAIDASMGIRWTITVQSSSSSAAADGSRK